MANRAEQLCDSTDDKRKSEANFSTVKNILEGFSEIEYNGGVSLESNRYFTPICQGFLKDERKSCVRCISEISLIWNMPNW